jgi:hypothetical protein
MQVHGIKYLFTLNSADFARFTPHITIFTPEEVLSSWETDK